MASRFLVLMALDARMTFSPKCDQYSFQFPTVSLSFCEFTGSRMAVLAGFSEGWAIEAVVEETDIDLAIRKTNDFLELLLSSVSFHSGLGMPKAKLILVYDITKGEEKRFFRQYFYDRIFSEPASVNLERLKGDVKKILTGSDQESNRILRAIRWFRKGLFHDDPLDQFLAFWHGLESLNSPLARKFGIEKKATTRIERTCPLCNKTYFDLIDSKGGIAELFEKTNVDPVMKRKINHIRNAISHGFQDVTSLYGPAIEVLPAVSRLLYQGISFVLDLAPNKSVFQNLERASPIKIGDFYFLEVFLLKSDEAALGKAGFHPYFLQIEANTETSEGKIVAKPTFRPFVDCAYQVYATGVSGRNIDLTVNGTS